VSKLINRRFYGYGNGEYSAKCVESVGMTENSKKYEIKRVLMGIL